MSDMNKLILYYLTCDMGFSFWSGNIYCCRYSLTRSRHMQ